MTGMTDETRAVLGQIATQIMAEQLATGRAATAPSASEEDKRQARGRWNGLEFALRLTEEACGMAGMWLKTDANEDDGWIRHPIAVYK